MAETKMIRRVDSDAVVYGRDLNRFLDVVLGNSGGRIKLYGDDGDALDLHSGAVTSTNNYSADIKSDAGYHQRWRHSGDLADVGAVTDAGLTLTGALNVTGASTFTGAVVIGTGAGGTLSVSGLVAAAAAMTVGTTLTVTGLLTGSTANFSGLVAMAAAATVGTTLTVAGHASALTLAVGTPAVVGAESLLVAGGGLRLNNNVSLFSADNPGGTLRGLLRYDNTNQFRIGVTTIPVVGIYGDYLTIQTASGPVFEASGTQFAFNGRSPTTPPSLSSDATDLASAIDLVNEIKDLLEDNGLAD